LQCVVMPGARRAARLVPRVQICASALFFKATLDKSRRPLFGESRQRRASPTAARFKLQANAATLAWRWLSHRVRVR